MSDIVEEIKAHDEMIGANMGYRSFSADEEKPESKEEEPVEEVVDDEEVSDSDDGESDDDVADEDDGDQEENDGEFKLPKVSPELAEEKKNLQRLVNDRMREVSGLRIKAGLADQIAANPEAVIRGLAAQYDISMTSKEVKESKKELDLEGLAPGDKESLPKFIARVMEKVLDARETNAPKQTQKQVSPSIREEVAKTLKYIQETYSDWGVYEKRMTALVTKHPSLYRDPDELYKLAKGTYNNPQDKAKSKKTTSKVKKVNSGIRSKGPVVTNPKGKKVPFNVAWDRAMREASK